ncbi:MAG: type II toxin-antitoxin system Phd/YefM family antitoxin [Candidatus Riflebacteria bacterium]|nr:type II toxin-antitoxin system Phd/YefM family antitoxin [Candidatus Riflebacteria bacterium]
MLIDTNSLISITEANQNFSKVAKLVDEIGSVVILKNNVPRYLIIDLNKANEYSEISDESLDEISKKLIEQNMVAYKVLAK